MHPRLLKLTIPKCTRAERQRVMNWLYAQGKDALMPNPRVTADAMRVAISYVLRDWTHWKDTDGTVYKAMAAAPPGHKGLCRDVNVQIRTPDGVQYSETICRLEAEEGKQPIRTGLVTGFGNLYRALDPDKLLKMGQDHLFDVELRSLAESLLEGSIDRLWPGTWLCLTDAPALEEVQALSRMLVTGSLTLAVLTLEQGPANRAILADELAREYSGQMAHLTRRLGLPRPRLEVIEQAYMRLCARIRQAEELLGVQVPCLYEQVTFEAALASTPA